MLTHKIREKKENMSTRKKKISKSKINSATEIALFLMLTMAVSLAASSAVNTAKALDWHAWLAASPNPVGVGQQVMIVAGFTLPTRGYGFQYYSGWAVTVTDPNGDTQTLGPFTASSTGTFGTSFVPDEVGTWKIKAHYPGGYADLSDAMNTSIPAADTNEFSLTVQEEPLTWPDAAPLPTEYWQFPIYGENREWLGIAGNWLQPAYDAGVVFGTLKGSYVPYTTVPDSAHVLWTKPLLFGGIVGGNTTMTYYTGSIYRGELQPPVIINGRLYYNEMEPPRHGWYCVDLATGETIWHINGTYPTATGGLVQGQDAQIQLGQILTVDTRNWKGGIAYLWSTAATTWAVWDAWTGDLLYTIANAPVKSPGWGPDFVNDPSTGTLLSYVYDAQTTTLVKWNSSKLIDKKVSADLGNIGRERPMYNLDWNAGVEWNVTIPDAPAGINILNAFGFGALYDPKDPSIIIASNQTRSLSQSIGAFEDIAISGIDGHVLWRKVRNEGTWEWDYGTASMEDDVYVMYRKETRQYYAYRMSTGAKLWVSDPYPNPWAQFIGRPIIAYGKLFSYGYDGKVWAHDAQTGKVVWDWGPNDIGLETPYGQYPLYASAIVADNKILVAGDELGQSSPLYRGQKMFVIDAESGETVWSISGVFNGLIAAGGYVLGPNGYDGKLYTFGKGSSATTVEAPMAAITEGSSLVIRGTVIDIAAGTKQDEQAARFPNGVAAVSDDSMSAWMEYVYMQQPMPSNVTGVMVSLDVVDANGNFRNIGNATTDATGFYSLEWTPDIPGKYTVYATFAGSNSYYKSYADTSFVVDEAPAATPAPTPEPQSMADLYFMPMSIGIIVAVIIVGVLLAILLLRKR